MRSAPARSRVRRPLLCENLEIRATISDTFVSAVAVPALSAATFGQVAQAVPPPHFDYLRATQDEHATIGAGTALLPPFAEEPARGEQPAPAATPVGVAPATAAAATSVFLAAWAADPLEELAPFAAGALSRPLLAAVGASESGPAGLPDGPQGGGQPGAEANSDPLTAAAPGDFPGTSQDFAALFVAAGSVTLVPPGGQGPGTQVPKVEDILDFAPT